MTISKHLSDRLKILSLICTFLVVWRHSTNMVAFYQDYRRVPVMVSDIEWTFSQVTNIAVPIFFMISGFFFLQRSYYGMSSYIAMIRKKTQTLLMPFLLWNCMGFFILLAAGENEWPSHPLEFLKGMLYSDYNGVLWYVRNLVIMMVLYPLYGWIFVADRLWLYMLLIAALMIWWVPDDCSVISSQGWFFFLLGGIVAKKQMLLQGGTTKRALFVGFIIWLLLCVLHRYVGVVGTKMGIFLGIVVLWWMTELLSSAIKRKLLSVAVYSFFVYVMHSFVIRTMKVLLAHNFPQNEAIALVAYFVLPIITFALLLLMGHYWKRLLPRMYSVCMGGRG